MKKYDGKGWKKHVSQEVIDLQFKKLGVENKDELYKRSIKSILEFYSPEMVLKGLAHLINHLNRNPSSKYSYLTMNFFIHYLGWDFYTARHIAALLENLGVIVFDDANPHQVTPCRINVNNLPKPWRKKVNEFLS